MNAQSDYDILPGIEITDPDSGIKIIIPNGWIGQKSNGVFLLQNPSVPGLIIVNQQIQLTQEKMLLEFQNPIQDGQLFLTPFGNITKISSDFYSQSYQGTINGMPACGIGFGRYIEGAGAIFSVAIGLKTQFSQLVENAAASLLKSMQYLITLENPNVIRKVLSGNWIGFTTNSQSRIVLHEDGTYKDYSESASSGQFRNATYGIQTGYWGVGSQNQARGHWDVKGSKERGTLFFTSQDGKTGTFQYRVHTEKGTIYWNEYYIGGQLYSRSK